MALSHISVSTSALRANGCSPVVSRPSYRRTPSFAAGALLLALIPSCGDETSGNEVELSEAESAIIGTWKQTHAESRIGTDDWVVADDVDCRADNTEQYDADGAWTLFDGTNQCGAGTGILAGTWRLAASDTKVVYTYEDASGEYESTVETLTDTEMVLTFSTGKTDGSQTRYTFRKQ